MLKHRSDDPKVTALERELRQTKRLVGDVLPGKELLEMRIARFTLSGVCCLRAPGGSSAIFVQNSVRYFGGGTAGHPCPEMLGIAPSYSRTRVSDDNHSSEALSRSCKCHVPSRLPRMRFIGNLDAVRIWWVHGFVLVQ